nr:MAG TPA: hypothetical protein [Caudoviricetes sp.]
MIFIVTCCFARALEFAQSGRASRSRTVLLHGATSVV